ncbi:hypothetical protein GCM10023185_32770 [Hymenobacter saemangeumensis]|uniref:Secretion system C-terminal sorting domain-containing protein n=1 Tax=Hymenobacter saemangeumensis TaxID=1084522 RepID=A0ABP8INH7_9BACT
MKKVLTLLLAAALPLAAAQANNLEVVYNGFSPAGSTAYNIAVNVSWENSWRDSENWDAAWLFVKYRIPGSGVWHTATLATSDAAHTVPGGAVLNAALDGKGVFVYRAALGSGSFSAQNLQLRWNAAADGVPSVFQSIQVKVFAVEMVRIPEGGFNINSGALASTSNEFLAAGSSLTRITSEAPLAAGAIRWVNETGSGGSGNELTIGGTSYSGSTALGANYPKGFAATYCMKYEISQGQYTDFLNSLTRAQQIRRVPTNISGDSPAGGNIYVMANTSSAATAFRNTITSPASGMGTSQPITFGCARPDRAANFLIWADGSAYLDWAGLRPMTELEYEKTCRGPQTVVPGEFAWGSTTIGRAANISGTEDGTETTDATANIAYNVSGATPYVSFVGGDGGDGPLRNGIFARANTTREQAGASYYGVMELSGNCWERCITVAETDAGFATNAGQFNLNNNGDGELDASGDHNVPTWPLAADARGSNYRGGNWSRHREWAMVADRTYGGFGDPSRTSHRGMRGVRSASTVNPANPLVSLPAFISPTRYQGGSFDGHAVASGFITNISGTRPACATCAGVTATLLPNPVSETATLRLSGRPALTDATLTITDALGRVVRKQQHLRGLELQISRNGLAPGIYQYQVSEHGEWVVYPGKLAVE